MVGIEVIESGTGTFVKLVHMMLVTGSRRVIVSLALMEGGGGCSLIWSTVGVGRSLAHAVICATDSVSLLPWPGSWYSPEDWQCGDDLQTRSDLEEQHEKATDTHYNGWYEGSRSGWSDSAL